MNTGADRGLAGRVLAAAGREHLAEDHLAYLIRLNARAGEQRPNDMGSEVGSGNFGERSTKLSDRGAARGYDDDIIHGSSYSFLLVATCSPCRGLRRGASRSLPHKNQASGYFNARPRNAVTIGFSHSERPENVA